MKPSLIFIHAMSLLVLKCNMNQPLMLGVRQPDISSSQSGQTSVMAVDFVYKLLMIFSPPCHFGQAVRRADASPVCVAARSSNRLQFIPLQFVRQG